MERAYRVVRAAVAVGTVLVCALLIWQAVDIYLKGTAPENFSAPGVAIEQMYRRDDIAGRLRGLLPVFIGYGVLVAAGAVLRFLAGEQDKLRVEKPVEVKSSAGSVRVARYAVLAAAVAFIGLGIWNGGLWDVLVKAINICTECIGLG